MTDQASLAQKTCVPCKGGTPRLDRDQAREMIAAVDGWELNDDATRISRRFGFKDFAAARAFAAAVGDLAEAEFHHPEIAFGWGYCRVDFQTRKIRGLHENDFIMAAKVNRLFGRKDPGA
ncbi:MAG: 4a-hydroxytetrahydrobiopterin dehydratase [Rhodospirillales bacterium]